MYKVCIIGAGPAGMVLALALCKRDNVEVTVFEKGPSHLASTKFNPDRSYTIDMTGHGAKALGKLYYFQSVCMHV